MKILVAIGRGDVKDTFLPPEVVNRLESAGTVVWNETDRHLAGDALRDMLSGVDVCVTGWGGACFNEHVLQGADRLKLIAHTGGSVATLVTHAVYDRGITVVSGNWLYAESVAEGVVAYMLCALRDLPHYAAEVQAGRWRTERIHNEGLLDQTVGLVGFGMVARYLVPMLKPFRTTIRAYDPYVPDEALAAHNVERAALEDVVSQSKIVSVHAAKTPGTRHLLNRDLLKSVRDGALLVNTARGSVIDEEALADELATGRFKAVLDVFEEEPLPAASRLRGLDNCILIPHMAGPTTDRRKNVTMALIDEMERFTAGKPLKYSIGRDYAMAMTR